MEKTNDQNVMLLCLSLANTGRGLTNYYDGNEGKYEGFITNEAPVKCVINKLKRKRKKLNQIVIIASTSSREKVLVNGWDDLEKGCKSGKMQKFAAYVEREKNDRGVDLTEFSALDMWKHSIITYLHEPEIKEFYGDEIPQFSVIEIPDDTKEFDVVKAVTKAADCIVTREDSETNLYIDYNGGQRYIAFMLFNIAKLSEIRNVKVRAVLTMNFEKMKNNRVLIENMIGVFKSDILVSGINAFITYGRVKILKDFFKDSSSKRIDDCIRLMECLANNMQLCCTAEIMRIRKELRDTLKQFIEYYNENDTDIYEVLFYYVANDIYEDYRDLFEAEIPSIILWCLRKDFVQQALTFAVERTPEYFWDSGLYKPNRQELEEYNKFWIVCRECLKNGSRDYEIIKRNMIIRTADNIGLSEDVNKMAKDFIKNYKGFDKKYSWFTKYLFYSDEKIGGVPVSYSVAGKDPQYVVHPDNRFSRIDYLGIRAESCAKKTVIQNIMEIYDRLKKDRNATNHAGDGRRSYDDICNDLELFSNYCIKASKIKR